MGKASYIGVSSKAHKIKKGYIGVGGKARKIKKAYIGVNGKARLWWSGLEGKFIAKDQYNHIYTIDMNNNYSKETGSAAGGMNAIDGTLTWVGDRWFMAGHAPNYMYAFYSVDGITWTALTLNSYENANWLIYGITSDEDYYYVAYYRTGFNYVTRIHHSTLQRNTKYISEEFTGYLEGGSGSAIGMLPNGKVGIVTHDIYRGYFRAYDFETDTFESIESNSEKYYWILSPKGYKNGVTYFGRNGGQTYNHYMAKYQNGVITQGNTRMYTNNYAMTSMFLNVNGTRVFCRTYSEASNLFYTENMSTFTKVFTGPSLNGLTYGDGKYILSRYRNGIYVSQDGTTWTKLIDTSSTYENYYDLAFNTTNGYGDS